MNVTVTRLDSATPLPAALRGIYVEAFPPKERAAWPEMATAHTDGQQITFIAWCDGEPVGFAFLDDLAPLPMGLLSYLAVTPEHRCQGIGGLLLQAVRSSAAALGWGSGLAIEVETVSALTVEERAIQTRRLGFYRRHGAVDELDIAYAMPDMLTGEPLPMHLLTLPVNPAVQPIPARRLVEGIYATAYPFHDETLAAVLTGNESAYPERFPEAVIEMLTSDAQTDPHAEPNHRLDPRQAATDFYAAARTRAEDVLQARQQVRRSHEP